MKPKKWLSILGEFQSRGNTLTFKGGIADLSNGQTGHQVGNFVNDIEFGGGVISATIRFHKSAEHSAAGLILYYDPPTRGFIEAQLGGLNLCGLHTYGGERWTTHAANGQVSQIVPDRDYHLSVSASGSRIIMEIDGIRALDANLGFSLPTGQSGIWAMGPNDISISNFEVETENPKLFVVMQFTEPFNELYSEVIRPVASKLGFEVIRADEQMGPGLIIADIENQILEARAILAEITPKNPNVYWELGYAHALKKPTIMIAERDTELPFDVSPFRVLFYENTIAGKSHVEEGLQKHLSVIQREWSLG